MDGPKHIPFHQITEFWTFLWITLFNKDVAGYSPWKKNPKINKRTPMFIPESRVGNFILLFLFDFQV